MALYLAAKPADGVYRYTWEPPLVAGDSLSSVILTETGCTVDSYELDGSSVIIFVSAGVEGVTASIAAEAGTADGETLVDVLYIPIVAPEVTADNTARNVCYFALRPVYGAFETPTATSLADAIETLNDMLAEWKIDGLDMGVSGRLVANDTMTVRDEFLSAIKYNLRFRIAELYGMPIGPVLADAAVRTKMLAGNVLFSMPDLTFDRLLLKPQPMTSINDL